MALSISHAQTFLRSLRNSLRCLAAVAIIASMSGIVSAQEQLVPAPSQPTTFVSGTLFADGNQAATSLPSSGCCANSCEPARSLVIKFSPYGWLTEMRGDIGVRGVTAPLDISYGHMWNLDFHELDFAFLGQLEASYGRAGFLANGAFFELQPGAHIRSFDLGSRVSETALDLDFTYTLFGTPDTRCGCDNFKFDLLGGIRYYSLTGDISITGPNGNTVSDSGARAWSDLVFGGRVQIPVNDKWTLQARADAGGFGISGCSRMAWNVETLAVYHCSETCSLFAGWRWLDVNYVRGQGRDQFTYDVQTDGPMMGLTIKF